VVGWLSRACGTSTADVRNTFRHVSAATEARCSEITPAATIQPSATLITARPTWNNTVRAHVNTSEDAVNSKWQHRAQTPRVSRPSIEEENKSRGFKLPQRFQTLSRTPTALEENVHDTLISVRPLLPTHCRCRGSLLHLIIFNETHTHTHSVGLPWKGDQTDE